MNNFQWIVAHPEPTVTRLKTNGLCNVKIELGPAFPLRLIVFELARTLHEWEIELRIAAEVRDCKTGEQMHVNHMTSIAMYAGWTTSLPDLVHEALRDLLLHELDEAWTVHGVRMRDPHAPRCLQGTMKL